MPIVHPGSSRADGHRRARRRAPRSWSAGPGHLFRGASGEGLKFVLFMLLLALVALFGGSSRPDAWQLLILRPSAVLLATAIWIVPPAPITPGMNGMSLNVICLRGPGLLLAALALVIAAQLVPLPPALWTALPGHAPYLEAARAAGMDQPWRPITVSFDLTLNSLVALAVPGAVLLGAAALRPDQRIAAAGLLVGVAVFSALLGLGQVTGTLPYLFALSSLGRPTGLFANINHQAAVLAATIPLAVAWGMSGRSSTRIVRSMVGGASAVLLFATILVSGSRAGLLLAGLAILCVLPVIGSRLRLPARTWWLVVGSVGGVAAALVAMVWASGQLSGLDRLLGEGSDQRTAFLPIVLERLRSFAPWGSGFGTFDAVFRQVEPDWALRLTYFNHAHNDLLELALTGGVAAVAVAVAFLIWLGRRGLILFGSDRSEPLARAGVIAAALLLLASLADYPLRTPLAGAVLALASLWAAERRHPAE